MSKNQEASVSYNPHDDEGYNWDVVSGDFLYDSYAKKEQAEQVAALLNVGCGNPEDNTHTEHNFDTCQ